MNGFISKYRWIIIIVASGLVAGVVYYSQQGATPVAIVAEQSDVAVSDTIDEALPEEAQPSEDVVMQEEATQVEDVVVEVQETETPPREPDPIEVVEEGFVVAQEAVVEDDVTEEEPVVETAADEPVVETIEVDETAEATAAPVEEKPVSDTSSTPDVTVDAPIEDTTEEATEEQTSDATAVIEALATTITVTSDEETTDTMKPSFDVVRVDPTGSAVIAGTAEPFSKVVILSNGENIGEAIAGASGEFVAIIQIPDNEQGQTLELETEIAGQLLFSDETILILPIMRSDAADTLIEESAPPIIRATAEEVVILQGAPTLALGQVSLDSISYDENDEVVLAGRGNPGRTIIIYVDDTPLMDAVVSGSGSWKQALHGLDAGRYVLRVDEIDEDGNVTSRVESPFQREYPEDVREAKATNDTTYTVQPGNSLWIIATGRYGDGLRYHQIFSANKDQIRDPDLIYPGQVFAIPDPQE